MPVVFECDAVLFDMDGTLVDSRAIVERMWLRWADERGLSRDAVLAVAHGRRTFDTIQLIAPQLATEEEAARLDALEALEEGGELPIAGAADLLAALPAERWAVVTSAGRDLALTRLASVGLPHPAVLVGAEDVDAGKPAPDGYLRAAALLGVAASRAVVLEDTPAGIESGRRAGAAVIGVRTTYPDLGAADALVPDLRSVRLDPSRNGSLRLIVHSEGS